jgi:hypothetical protein
MRLKLRSSKAAKPKKELALQSLEARKAQNPDREDLAQCSSSMWKLKEQLRNYDVGAKIETQTRETCRSGISMSWPCPRMQRPIDAQNNAVSHERKLLRVVQAAELLQLVRSFCP